jgi:hypothetical protein
MQQTFSLREADPPDSPVMTAHDPEERVTILFVPPTIGPTGRRSGDEALTTAIRIPLYCEERS